MKNLMHDNLCMAKQFSDTVRYIDDLLTLNNSNFEEEIPNIYPPEVQCSQRRHRKCNFVCLLHFPEYSAQLVPKVHIKMITNLH